MSGIMAMTDDELLLALRQARERVQGRVDRLSAMVRGIDTAIDAINTGEADATPTDARPTGPKASGIVERRDAAIVAAVEGAGAAGLKLVDILRVVVKEPDLSPEQHATAIRNALTRLRIKKRLVLEGRIWRARG